MPASRRGFCYAGGHNKPPERHSSGREAPGRMSGASRCDDGDAALPASLMHCSVAATRSLPRRRRPNSDAGTHRSRQERRQGRLLHGHRSQGRARSRQELSSRNIPASPCRSNAPAASASISVSRRSAPPIFSRSMFSTAPTRRCSSPGKSKACSSPIIPGRTDEMAGGRARSRRRLIPACASR